MKDFLTTYGNIISAFIVITGWWIVAWLNRKNAIAIERAKYHIEALKTILDMAEKIVKNKGNLRGIKIHVSAMQQFSYNNEWKLYREFIDLIQTKDYDGAKALNILKELINIAHVNIRKELRYPRTANITNNTPN